MKESEARQKWCPMARVDMYPDGEGLAGLNRNTNNERVRDRALCVASDCMMWRWNEGDGYCGLAGPQP